MKIKADYANAPQWKEVTIKSTLPAELKCLDELAHNMWWAWNYEARDMWKSLDNALYEEVGHNPVMLLDRLSYERKEAIVKDKAIMERVKAVYKKFREYMDVAPDATRPSVAYFCMEYGINQVVKIYSGGLGMLAGDYMKEASDSNVNMCGVGFLYRYGYFKQTLSMDGQQIAQYDAQNFNSLPVERVLDENGQPMVVDVPYMNYQVHAYVWVMNVGRIKLYLLDTDNEMNSEFDKPITHALYGGDNENRLKQEILLGIGGMLTLKKLGIKKDIYHATRATQLSATSSVLSTTSRKDCRSTRLLSSFALLHSIQFTLRCLLATTTSTSRSSASTWAAIPACSASLGTSSSAWVVQTPMTTQSASVCLHSLATHARRSTA